MTTIFCRNVQITRSNVALNLPFDTFSLRFSLHWDNPPTNKNRAASDLKIECTVWLSAEAHSTRCNWCTMTLHLFRGRIIDFFAAPFGQSILKPFTWLIKAGKKLIYFAIICRGPRNVFSRVLVNCIFFNTPIGYWRSCLQLLVHENV